MTEMPRRLCNLFNMQTLKVSKCLNLRHLPDGIGKLVNLQHIHIDGCDRLERLPKGIAKLTCLDIGYVCST